MLDLKEAEELLPNMMLDLQKRGVEPNYLNLQSEFLNHTVKGLLKWLKQLDDETPIFLYNKSAKKHYERLGVRCRFEFDLENKKSVSYLLRRYFRYLVGLEDSPKTRWVERAIHISPSFEDLSSNEEMGPAMHMSGCDFVYYHLRIIAAQLKAVSLWYGDCCFNMRLSLGRSLTRIIDPNKHKLELREIVSNDSASSIAKAKHIRDKQEAPLGSKCNILSYYPNRDFQKNMKHLYTNHLYNGWVEIW